MEFSALFRVSSFTELEQRITVSAEILPQYLKGEPLKEDEDLPKNLKAVYKDNRKHIKRCICQTVKDLCIDAWKNVEEDEKGVIAKRIEKLKTLTFYIEEVTKEYNEELYMLDITLLLKPKYFPLFHEGFEYTNISYTEYLSKEEDDEE